MVSTKRKPEVAPAKKSHKRPKTESTSKPEASIKEESTPAKPKPSSVLAKEQPAFPRGGASILTPVERKQIRAKAAQDADREAKPIRDLFGKGGTTIDSEADDDAKQASQPKTQVKGHDKKKGKGKKQADAAASTKSEELQIGGLSYKRVTTGSLVFGQIASISARTLTVALPNNLAGYVPLTAVSPQLGTKIQALLDKDEDEDNASDDEQEDDDISLISYFRVGQYLRTSVTATEQEKRGTGSSMRKRIELSVEPALTNSGIERSNLAVGATVQVSVDSVEDHGLVVELALEDDKVRGFVPQKHLPSGLSLSEVKTGSVFLCHVLDTSSNNKVVKLSADLSKAATLKTAPSVDIFLPGTKAEILISNVTDAGLAGKVMGLLDVTADIVHSGSFRDKEAFLAKYKIGEKIPARLICNFPLSDNKKLGFSVLNDLLDLASAQAITDGTKEKLALSSITELVPIIRVEPGLGAYLQLDEQNIGFAHVSRLSDKKLDSLSEVSGPFKLGSEYKARILEYNPVDALYIVSLQQSVLEQPFLGFEDVHLGAVVKGTIEKVLVGASGVDGLFVTLAEGVTGKVSKIHLSDVKLDHPEKKFREGQSVTARVVSVNPETRRLGLTLKKSFVNSDQKAWLRFEDVEVGNSTVGTLVKVTQQGAVVRFFGIVKGFLPVSEMSEAYIKDATDHFRVGQIVLVNALAVNAAEKRLTLSCRDVNRSNASFESSLWALQAGTFANGTVFEKSENDILLRLEGSDAIARLSLDHVADGSLKKRQSAFSKIRVGQRLEEIVILEIQAKRRLVLITNKQSLIKATRDSTFLRSYKQLQTDAIVTGFVKNITEDGIFVGFAAGISGLIPKTQVPVDDKDTEKFGMVELQAVTSKVMNIDYKGATPRFWLTMREKEPQTEPAALRLTDSVDVNLKVVHEFAVGTKTKAKVISIKDTQINVELAKDVQGRIDVSEIFDDWKDIKDRKKPLGPFYPKLELTVRVLGAHDTRNHKFLPLTHRQGGKNTVFELTCKPSSLASETLPQLTLKDMAVGSSWLAFVNNISDEGVWVNISPSIRGRIRPIDVSDNLSLASNMSRNFPLGSALRVRVLAVDPEKGHLDLTARSDGTAGSITLANLTEGLVLPGRVTKVTDHNVIVQLSEQVVGSVELVDMSDDFTTSNPAKYQKNEILRVCVLSVDAPNKKISLSARASKALSSSMEVVDREITSINQIAVHDLARGFIKNVSDTGIFVTIGRGVVAFVRIGNLSDSYLKDWKNDFQRDQLVSGRITLVDEASGRVQMTLKESALKPDYKAPMTFNDLKVGDIVTGKVAKVESFGVFIVVDNSEKIRGLCHRSEIAEQRVEDATKLFAEGDKVKAKVLKVDLVNRKVNFGMKASYFTDLADEDAESEHGSDEEGYEGGVDVDVKMGGVADETETVEDDDAGSEGEASEDDMFAESDGDDDDSEVSEPEIDAPSSTLSKGLVIGGFDWTGLSSTLATRSKRALGTSDSEADDDEDGAPKKKKKKSHRAEIQVDHTGDLATQGPQSPDDFERLLIADPDNSHLWLQYMAFHLDLGDVDAVRAIAERALRTITLGLEEEKINIFTALLNLEVHFGDAESVEIIFKRACEVNDAQEIHARLASIYIKEGKFAPATDVFENMLKKFNQDPKVWLNYASFLLDKISEGGAEKARALMPRALKTLPQFTHFDTTKSFARLEFTSAHGVAERGRTIFEGLIASFPKRLDLFNVLLDLEISVGGDDERVRGLFERVVALKLKTKQARGFFKRWEEFERGTGEEKRVEMVRVRAVEWVRRNAKGE